MTGKYIYTATDCRKNTYGVLWDGKTAEVTYSGHGSTHAVTQEAYAAPDENGLSIAICRAMYLGGIHFKGHARAALSLAQTVVKEGINKAHQAWLDGQRNEEG